MTVDTVRRCGVFSLAAVIAACVALAQPSTWARESAGDKSSELSPSKEYFRLLDRAWGPEPAEKLDAFLAVREELKPIFERYHDGMIQWSLREAGTRPMFSAALFGVFKFRRELDQLLQEKVIDFDDYRRLSILVYGRWLRAVRDEVPPERHLARSLQELDVGIERHLAHNPPGKARERQALEERLAAVRHHLACVKHFAFSEADKREVIERIDPRTRAWLEEHRARVEELDFGVFDTAPPSRE